jgi:hypothetical protein
LFSRKEWKRRILTFLGYGGRNRIRCTTKALILEWIGGVLDQDASAAFDELIKEKLVEPVDGKFFTINLDKRDVIDEFVNSEPEERLDLIQPLKNGLEEYVYRFVAESKWEYANQRAYYYYTRKDDPTFWIVITKKKGVGRDDKIILGSFDDANSRLSKIWRATKQAAKREPDGKFIRRWVEDLEPEACGNNRMPSGAAFRLFRYLKMIDIVDTKGKSEFYKITGKEPNRDNLDKFFGGQ